MRSSNPFTARHLRVVRPAGDADIVGALNAPPDPPGDFGNLSVNEQLVTITGLPDAPLRLTVEGREPYWSPVPWGTASPTGPDETFGTQGAAVLYDPMLHAAWVRLFVGRIHLEIVVEGAAGCTALHKSTDVEVSTGTGAVTDLGAWTLLAPGADACADAARPPSLVEQHGQAPVNVVGPRPYVPPVDPVTGKPVTDGSKKTGNGLLWAAAIALGLGGLWYATKE